MNISLESATIIDSIISAIATIIGAIIASKVVSKAITSIQINNTHIHNEDHSFRQIGSHNKDKEHL